jgi:dynein intermediate chain 1, axonemal
VEQKAYEKAYKSAADDRRRQKIMAAQEAGKELGEGDADDDNQRNQFNYTERAAQTYNNTVKSRVVSTVPPESATTQGRMTQWSLYDAYLIEYDRMVYASNMEKAAKEAKGKEKGGSSRRSDDPMHSPAMGRTLKVLERMVNQNAEDEIYADFKFWEDPSDAFRDAVGTCLPLWKFEDARTKRKMVTAIAWNPGYPDLFAVGYGSYDFMKQGSGLVAVYSVKNVGTPEYTFSVESGVMCIDFHPQHHPLLAVGCYDGTVKVFDVRRKENRPIFSSDIRSGKHTDPVWEVRWASDDGSAKDLSFYSVSSDGKVANWIMTKSELKMELVMALKLTGAEGGGAGAHGGDAGGATAGGAAASASAPSARGATPPGAKGPAGGAGGGAGEDESSRPSGLAGGCAIAFNPFQESVFLVGTEEGKIHRCSLEYSGQGYLATYEGHHMAVYAIRWNPFHPRVFLSSSADWTVKMWDSSYPAPLMSYDLGTSVGDICWAPYSASTFAAVSDDGKVHVWDLYANKHEQLCQQKVREGDRILGRGGGAHRVVVCVSRASWTPPPPPPSSHIVPPHTSNPPPPSPSHSHQTDRQEGQVHARLLQRQGPAHPRGRLARRRDLAEALAEPAARDAHPGARREKGRGAPAPAPAHRGRGAQDGPHPRGERRQDHHRHAHPGPGQEEGRAGGRGRRRAGRGRGRVGRGGKTRGGGSGGMHAENCAKQFKRAQPRAPSPTPHSYSLE